MKKVLTACFFVLFLSSSACAGKAYFSIGGGGGAEAKAGNIRIEAGGYTTDKAHNLLFGVGIPFTFNRDEVPAGTLEYPVPHPDYTSLGTRRKGEEAGAYLKAGFEPVSNTGIFVFALGGVTSGKEISLAQSNVTGWLYEQSESTRNYGLFGGGIGFFPKHESYCLHFEYDNRMGFTGNIGFTW
ncbi:MAG: hypothetical protein ACE14T_10620 [Syntrophales bacterium]